MLGFTETPFTVCVVNNGTSEIELPWATVVNVGKNAGWAEGMNSGAKQGKAPYILMLNDDTQILEWDNQWLDRLLEPFEMPSVGAVGPTSNAVMGYQNIRAGNLPKECASEMLSGFCLLTRRDLFEELGGLDAKLPFGDDVDYSIRVRDKEKLLVIRRDVFVYHHYAQTGARLYGKTWDSVEFTNTLRAGLIRKHGFKRTMQAIAGGEPICLR